MKIAVYGTLRQGYGNNKYCLARSKFITVGTVQGINMYSNGGFPICARTDDKGATVVVEVFDVVPHDLALCDRLEGHPTWYKREPVTVLAENGEWVEAEMYLQEEDDVDHLNHIVSGDWKTVR